MKKHTPDLMSKIVAVAVLAAITGWAQAGSYTLSPTDDAKVREAAPSFNYGNDVYLSLSDNTTAKKQYSFLKFDLTGIPTGEIITGAVLNLYEVSGPTTPPSTNLFYVADDTWTNNGITWNNQPAPTQLLDTQTVTELAWNTWSVPGSLFSTDTDGHLSLMVKLVSTNSTVIQLASQDIADSSKHPYLQVMTVVPEPETWAMLLAGLGLVGAMARRRKQAWA